MRVFFLLFLFKSLFAYYLVVNTQDEADKLKQIGIDCKFNNYEQYYVCAQSDDLEQLKRVKRYIGLNYSISTYIVKNDTEFSQKTVAKENRTQNENNKITKISEKKENEISLYPPVKSGYCIQVAASKSKNAMLKMFEKYADYPYARVEKIGSYYVLRVGESNKYKDIKSLKNRIGKGFVRKCDYKLQRIVKSKKKINNSPVFFQPEKKHISVVEKMYNELNAGNLAQAQKSARNLINTKYFKDAYNVLGIISLKKKDYYNSCRFLKKSNNNRLKKTACYLYYLQKGYSVLNFNPAKAYKYFKKAAKYKNTDDVKEAFGYVYLNMKQYKKAENIFKRLYKKHPGKISVVKGYVISLYNLKDYDKLKKLKSDIPVVYYPEIEEYFTYVDINEANEMIKNKKFKQAEEKLLDMYKKYRGNTNIKLSLAGLYLKTGKFKKAERLYKEVLNKYPENIYALEGLRGIELKKGNLKKALEYSSELKKLGIYVDDTNTKNAVELKNLQKYINNGECDNAIKTIKKLKDNDSAEKFMIIGDYYKKCERNSTLAYEFYKKGYQKKPSFGIRLKYLYALLNEDKLNEIKKVLSEIDEAKLTSVEKIKLKQFLVDYYTKLAGSAFENKEYKKALKLCKKAFGYGNSPACNEIAGWSCFKLKDYKCASINFEQAGKYTPDNEKNKYALALSYMNLKQKQKAEKLLDQISDTKNEKLKLNVAEAYIAIGKLSKGEKLLKNTNDTNLSEKIVKIRQMLKIKKSDYLSYLEAGVDFRFKTGTQGLDKLNDSLSYLKGKYFINENKFVYFTIGSVSLFSGALDDYNSVGSVGGTDTPSQNWITDFQGFVSKIGFDYENNNIFKADVGVTPISNDIDIDYAYIGKITLGTKISDKKYLFSLFRKPVKDSILSYVGNNDPYGGFPYGRVLENGVKFEYENSFDENDSILYLALNMSNLVGENVKNNKKYEFEALGMKYTGSSLLTYDYAGFYGMYQKFRYNENSFLYGNGGYFSPSYFVLVALRYEGYQFLQRGKFGLKAYLSGGILRYKEDDATTSLGFEAGSYAKYLIDENFALKGGLVLRKSADYSDFYIGFALQYYFGTKYRVTKQELNRGLKEMLTTW